MLYYYHLGGHGMAKIISLFNHKGGVSKTTTTYHMGWMLAEKGHRVLMVDTDAQCNLTGLVLGEDKFEEFYEENSQNNIKAALDPAFLGQPNPIKPIEGINVRENLWLVPGHIDITEFDISLGMAHNFSTSMAILMNLPGAIYAFLQKMIDKYQIEYVLIDMNPSLSETNKNLLMISDYFIVPTAPDFFSQMALSTLATIVPKWKKWSLTAKTFFSESIYPFPDKNPMFLGIVMQNFTIRNGKPATAFKEKIDKVIEKIQTTILPTFKSANLLLPTEKHALQTVHSYCLAYIPNFQSLVAKMQDEGAPSTPVFAIDHRYLETGIVRENYIKKMDELKDVFSNMDDLILELVKDE
jgi:cellulose biosynthesis protein BcsQ